MTTGTTVATLPWAEASAVADLFARGAADPRATLDRARDMQERARAAGQPWQAALCAVAAADALHRLGRLGDAVSSVRAVLDEVSDEHGELAVRCSWVLMRCFLGLGDFATSLEHGLSALEALDDTVPWRLRTQLHITLGDVFDELGDVPAARVRYGQAEEMAVGNAELHLRVLNNRAFSELTSGNVTAALADAARMQELAVAYGVAVDGDALDTIAHIHLAQDRPDLAVEAAIASLEAVGSKPNAAGDDTPEFLLTLAMARRRQGELTEAGLCLALAARLSGGHGYGDVFARVLEEQAELLAVQGDFRRAYETHRRFHAAERELLSVRREAQARARQTVYEADEARAEAARFREEARRDPLTRLANRLAVDERVPQLLEQAAPGAGVVAAVLFDLDHFKAVNDTYSHEAGDSVLVTFAEDLQAEADVFPAGSALAARLGGEEFLLVLAVADVQTACAAAERVRCRVESRDWSKTTPGRRVTVSAGVAVADPGSTQFSLLRRADGLLYAAKAGGRNRVCVEPRH